MSQLMQGHNIRQQIACIKAQYLKNISVRETVATTKRK